MGFKTSICYAEDLQGLSLSKSPELDDHVVAILQGNGPRPGLGGHPGSLTSGEHLLEAGLREDAFHLLTLVALDLYAPVFHCAADAAGFLRLLRAF